MKNKPNFEDIIGIRETDYLEYFNKQHLDIVEASKEYGRQMWNAALEWAAENAELNYDEEDGGQSPEIDKESILKGKI